MKKTAVVFAYHNVGARCLKVLVDAGIDIKLVVTHHDNPKENIWFDSVAKYAESSKLPYIKIQEPELKNLVKTVEEIRPDFIFSFYFRFMLPNEILNVAPKKAFNMHGSLLPKYRGRVPINWAIVNGETETGATLHLMEVKPDAGDIVDQKSVEILPDDTAIQVFNKVVDAAEVVLKRSIESIIENTFKRIPNKLSEGSYFGGRKPEDGRIDLNKSTQEIYNLIRAVSPPYPGAYIETDLIPQFYIYSAKLIEDSFNVFNNKPFVFMRDGRYFLQTETSKVIEIFTCGDMDTGEMKVTQFFEKRKKTINMPWSLK